MHTLSAVWYWTLADIVFRSEIFFIDKNNCLCRILYRKQIKTFSLSAKTCSEKMKPLNTSQKLLTWLSIYPNENGTRKCNKSLSILLISFIIVIEISFFVSSCFFVEENLSGNVEESLYALFQISGAIALIYSLIVSFYSRKNITAFFKSLANIYEASKNFVLIFTLWLSSNTKFLL